MKAVLGEGIGGQMECTPYQTYAKLGYYLQKMPEYIIFTVLILIVLL